MIQKELLKWCKKINILNIHLEFLYIHIIMILLLLSLVLYKIMVHVS